MARPTSIAFALLIWCMSMSAPPVFAQSTTSSESQVSAGSPDNFSVSHTEDLLTQIRQAATTLPGEFPLQINMIKVAESHRAYADIIEGGSDSIFVSARTAFQIRYLDQWIMLDSGMDEEVHRYYGFGRDEPYWPEKNETLQLALRGAQLILMTHEHGDHVAGVIRSEFRDELAPKTLLTQEQIDTLIERPQLPQIALTQQQAEDYEVLDYQGLHAVAPGVVLVKAPGHTAGHQMVYVQQTDGKEFLFIGDVGWSLDNITELKLRPAQTIVRIGEDGEALMRQMRWIKERMEQDNLIVIPSHDDRRLQELVAQRVIGDSLAP